MMKIMMKYNFIKEIVTWALNTITAHSQKQSYRLWWEAADQCTLYNATKYLYPYYDIENTELYN